MPVIINDFEVVTEAPPRAETAAQGQSPERDRPSTTPPPYVIEAIVDRDRERELRVAAH